jgi:S-adenosylmethionine/arginine decarboxylase-like enzyme
MMGNALTLRTTQVNVFDCFHFLMNDIFEMEIFLSKLVNIIDMTLISEGLVKHKNPHAFLYDPTDKDDIDHGVSGIAILVESHIAAHAWPKRKLLNVVITSCKDYDPSYTAFWIVNYCGSNNFKFESIKF